MSRYPDFICIGAQKAGTTWLQSCLAAHPSVFKGKFKEIHYFDVQHVKSFSDFNEKRFKRAKKKNKKRQEAGEPVPKRAKWLASQMGVKLDDQWYAGLFEDAKASKICTDITPSYSLLPDAGIEHLLRLCPDARVLLMVREPVDRAFSQVRMIVKKKKLRIEEKRLLKLAKRKHNARRSNYPAIIDRWSARLRPDRFKVVFFDDVAQRPHELLAEVCGFAGIDYQKDYFADASKVVHEGQKIAMPDSVRDYLVAEHSEVIREMAKRYPKQAGPWMTKHGLR